MELFCLGDSLTYGYGVRRSQCWPSLIQAQTGIPTHNHGVNGDTTVGLLARLQGQILPQMRQTKDCLATVLCGYNDIFVSGTSAGARAGMSAILQQLLAEGITPLVLIPMELGGEGFPVQWEALVDLPAARRESRVYADWLRLYCRTFGLPTLELEGCFRQAGVRRAALFLDGVHPTAEGHRLLAAAIADALPALRQ